MVSYSRRCGDGVPGAGRPDAASAARRPARAGRPDPGRADRPARDDPDRRGQAPAPARGGRAWSSAERRGREKLHYLNPVPIRLIHDRWVSKYTEPWVAGLAGLKTELEHSMEKVFEIYIRTTPERLWAAITDPAIRAKYHFGVGVESDWTPGSSYTLEHPGCGAAARRGREPRRRPATPAGPDHAHAVERGRRARGHLAGDLGDRAGRRLVPADRHPRPALATTPRRSSTAAGR